MYRLVFGRPNKYVVLKSGSLIECVAARALSGDLILNPQGKVIQSNAWLFDWEKTNPNCYAKKMQKNWTH